MRTNVKLLVVAILLGAPIAAVAQEPNVSGTWLAASNAAEKWIFDQKSGEIHVKELMGDKVKADFTCTLDGNECNAKEKGHSEKIMMYFNGSKLVEIRERNGDAVKQRITVSADGKTLTVETVPLSSSQKAKTYSFRRQVS